MLVDPNPYKQLQIQIRIHAAKKYSDSDPLVTTITYKTKDLFAFLRRKAALVKMCYLTFFTNCKIRFKYVGIIKIHRASFSPQPVCALFTLYGLRFCTKCFWIVIKFQHWTRIRRPVQRMPPESTNHVLITDDRPRGKLTNL